MSFPGSSNLYAIAWKAIAGICSCLQGICSCLTDLVAVLCPNGPLRLLVEEAQNRNESLMPALIYSSTVMYPYITNLLTENTSQMTPSSGQQNPDEPQQTQHTSEENRNQSPEQSRELLVNRKASGSSLEEQRQSVPEEPQSSNPPPQSNLSTSEEKRVTVSRRKVKVTEGGERLPYKDSDRGSRTDDVDVQLDEMSGDLRRNTVHSDRIVELRRSIEQEEDRGVKLGLGDFIFYSVLVGKASSYGDNLTTLACFIAILMGLFLTLAILVTVKKALPALPISIFFGLVMYFGTIYVMSPFANEMASAQIFL